MTDSDLLQHLESAARLSVGNLTPVNDAMIAIHAGCPIRIAIWNHCGPVVWSGMVSPLTLDALRWAASTARIPVNWLMAVIAHETSGTFATDICSGGKRWAELPDDVRQKRAVSWLQWTEIGVQELTRLTHNSHSKESIVALSPFATVELVRAWYKPWAGNMRSLVDVYCVTFWPDAVGKPAGYKLPLTARQFAANKGLDLDHDGDVDTAELATRIEAWLNRGVGK